MLINSLGISCHADLLKRKMNQAKIESIEKTLDSGIGNIMILSYEIKSTMTL